MGKSGVLQLQTSAPTSQTILALCKTQTLSLVAACQLLPWEAKNQGSSIHGAGRGDWEERDSCSAQVIFQRWWNWAGTHCLWRHTGKAIFFFLDAYLLPLFYDSIPSLFFRLNIPFVFMLSLVEIFLGLSNHSGWIGRKFSYHWGGFLWDSWETISSAHWMDATDRTEANRQQGRSGCPDRWQDGGLPAPLLRQGSQRFEVLLTSHFFPQLGSFLFRILD